MPESTGATLAPSVSAVVVTWNSHRDIGTCLASIITQSHPVSPVVVVDNGSGDGTTDLVRRDFPQVEVLELEHNEGFARANNLGIERLRTEWVLLVNPDAHLAPDYVQRLLEFAKPWPQVGALGGILLRDDGSGRVDSAGIEIFRSRRVRDRGTGGAAPPKDAPPEQVFGICAAAALYRRRMLDEAAVEGEVFPERFFAYYEDADLAWRAWRLGWQAWVVPSARAWHRRGGSPAAEGFGRWMTHRNRLWLVARNEPLWRPLTAFPELAAHEALMALRVLRHPSLIGAVIQSLVGLPAALRARRVSAIPDVPAPFQSGIGFSRQDLHRAAAPPRKPLRR